MAATSTGQIALDLNVNQGAFHRQMASIQNVAKKAGAALAGAFAVKKLVDFGKSCVNLGSDLAEVQNVVDVTFPKMNKQIDKFAKAAAGSFGLSETMAKKFTGTFGSMAEAFGFSEKESYKMSTALTGLAGDVASFYNISQDEAYTKLKSVFSGETETLKDLGAVMTQSALDAYALGNSYGKVTAKMSEAEKVSLRLAFVQDKLKNATGDFARTSNSWANQTRILSLQFESLKATIGQGLINAFTPVIRVINILLAKIQTLAKAFNNLTNKVFGDANGDSAGSGTADSLSSAADSSEKVADNTKKAAKEAKKLQKAVYAFDSLNKQNPEDTSKDSTGSGAGGTASVKVDADTSKANKELTALDKFLQKFKKKLKPTTDALKRLWNEGLNKLGNFAWGTLKDFYHDFLVPVGNWVLGKGLPGFIDATNKLLSDIKWNKIQNSLDKLYKALTPFAINIGEGLLWFYEKILVPLGTWVTSEVVPRFLDTLSIAINITNSVIDALKPLAKWFFEKFLTPIANWTGEIFLSVWDCINNALSTFAAWCKKNPGTIQKVTITVGSFFAAWKGIELLSFIQQSGSVIAALGRIGKALFSVTAAKAKDKLETMYLNLLYAKDFVKSIIPSTRALALQAKQFAINAVAKAKDKLETLYLKSLYAKDFVISVAQSTAALVKQAAQFAITTAAKVADAVAQATMTAATLAWNAVCTIATTLTTALGVAIAFLTSPIGIAIVAITAIIATGVLLYKNWDKVKEKAKKIWTKIKEIFQTFDNWLSSVFQKDFSKSFGAFGEIINAFKKNVQNIWNAIKKIFSGIIDFITGVFTGDWKKAWEGVKKIFGGIFDGLVAVAKAPLNLIIGLINTMLKGIFDGMNGVIKKVNKLASKLPDWMPGAGGIPTIDTSKIKIPPLATGGYVKPNTPQLAMIGDNRHQGEVVAPEDKLQELLNSAIMQNTALIVNAIENAMSKQKGRDIELVVNLGNKKIARAVLNVAAAEKKRMGKVVYDI